MNLKDIEEKRNIHYDYIKLKIKRYERTLIAINSRKAGNA
jgi:hypothetical protein